jgi:hypothetical protein
MINECEQLLGQLRGRWPPHWMSTPELSQALECLVAEARMGRPTSLPVVQRVTQQIAWLSIARSAHALRDYLDDARLWLEAVDAHAIGHDVTLPSNSSGPLAPMLKVLAPDGYMRWNTPAERGSDTLRRLHRMHRFLATRPELARTKVPSTVALRLEFISALSVGDWTRADACIGEIDHWSLAHAHTTLQMRIRLFEAQGSTKELFAFACRTQAWKLANPRRIAVAILDAVDICAIQSLELSGGFEVAYALYRTTWHSQLIHCVGDAKGATGAARLLAYAAAADQDRQALVDLVPNLPTDLAEFLLTQFPSKLDGEIPLDAPSRVSTTSAGVDASANVGSTAASESLAQALKTSGTQTADRRDGLTCWLELCAHVKAGNAGRARALLDSFESGLLDDPNFLAAGPNAILELLSDPEIEGQPNSRVLLYEVLTELVDTFVVAPGFPRLAHRHIYLSLLEGIVTLRAETANEADSQLVLGLVGALIGLSVDTVVECEQIIRAWWQRRPILQRLNWLAAALDTLAQVHSEPQRLIDLYIDGLTLAARKAVTFPATEGKRWLAIGQAVELPAAHIEELLAPLILKAPADQSDLLAGAGLRHVAIVSLREASAHEAAVQLQARTGAKVSIVTSLVSGQETRQAMAADLILYVWAATSHATYRAFDGCRDRLEYVQGTGATSIVMAAERWVARLA